MTIKGGLTLHGDERNDEVLDSGIHGCRCSKESLERRRKEALT